MKSRLPETPVAPRASLPAGQIALEAYWHVGRYARIYGAQVLVLSAIGAFLHLATFWLLAIVTARASTEARVVAHELAFIVTIVSVLVLGGTAIFIDCQRAIVLGLSPAIGHALKLRPGETRVLRAVAVYWLVVHLVPTAVVNVSYVAGMLQLDWFQRFPMPAHFLFYWAWVLATAPLVVMSLPIALFESAPEPLVQGRRRLQGNAAGMSVAGALAFLPLGAAEIAIYVVRDSVGSSDGNPLLFLLVDFLLMSFLQCAASFTTILVMSALVAVAYLRLSPRIESVYRVFD